MQRSKSKWKRFFESRLFFAAGIAALLFLSVNLIRSQLRDRAIRAEIGRLENEVIALESERAQYERLLTLFENPAFLEEEARRALGYVKPGEKVVVIEKREAAGDSDDKINADDLSNPKKWWLYFFGNL